MYNNIHQHGIFYNQLKKNDGKIIGMYPPSSTHPCDSVHLRVT